MIVDLRLSTVLLSLAVAAAYSVASSLFHERRRRRRGTQYDGRGVAP